MKMSTRRFEIERFSVTTSVPFEAVVSALKDAVGRLDLVEFAKASKHAGTFAELKEVIDRNLGKTGRCCSWNLITARFYAKKRSSPSRR
jgi:hypothetical protein